MKKKGFTLVELLAVIAILAILVIIVLPNIMSLFNQAKQNSFENELKQIFKETEQEWMKDSMVNTQSIVYARNKTTNCSKQLSLSGREEIEYYIEVDKGGNVIKYFATDGSYQYQYNGNGLKIEEIGNSKQVANLQDKAILTVTCDGAFKNGNNITDGEPGLYKIMAEQAVLDNSQSEFVTSSSGIKFDEISSDTNGKGIYEIASTKDDLYPIYYYRGAVTNNNVKFGGFCWKAVRTTNTGGVKLVYNGRPDASGHCANTKGDSTQIGSSRFNENIRSVAHIGYMYGTKNGRLYEEPYTTSFEFSFEVSAKVKFGKSVTYSNNMYTLTNTVNTINDNHHYTCFNESGKCEEVSYVYSKTSSHYYYVPISGLNPNGRELIDIVKETMFRNDKDSLVKIEIEKWYENNMTDYTSKIEDTVYCNDRSISNTGGWSPTGSLTKQLTFSAYTRINSTHTPSLVCERELDKFTVSKANGNGKLAYPVGLLTSDEIMLAGGCYNSNYKLCRNSSYYLYTNKKYCTASPYYVNDSSISEVGVQDDGRIGLNYYDDFFSLRPVVSISKNTIVTDGDGSANSPYVIG